MKEFYYKSLFNNITERSVEGTLSVLGIKNPFLREHLKNLLEKELKEGNRIIADPVFEAVFPWQESPYTFEELSKIKILSPSLVDALDAEHNNVQYHDQRLNLSSQALKKHFKPYTHQIKSWKILAENNNKSIVVTSGTGSGKTECFMIPILNDLVRQLEGGQHLEGVQALFIYPLNALINSQRERLLAWTINYGQQLRFCLYNGNTPGTLPQAQINNMPACEVHDRNNLWQSPPPILITNPTMLEYMLIRHQDRPILEKSQGKLKYIVLDEAHTYIGSQAAELALLIRRVLNGFGVSSDDVRFIATSATIGSSAEAKNSLKQYLADIAGVSSDSIEIVDGSRHVPALPDITNQNDLTAAEVNQQPVTQREAALFQNPKARNLRSFLQQPQKLSDIGNHLFPDNNNSSEKEQLTLEWLDVASNQDINQTENHFLPLRGHFFHKVLGGLWACINKNCHIKQKTPLSNDNDWPYGMVYSQQKLACECGAPVYELAFCNDCNTPHLQAEISGDQVSQVSSQNNDEFSYDLEHSEEEESNVNTVTNKLIIGLKVNDHFNKYKIDSNGILNSQSIIQYEVASDFILNGKIRCSNCDFSGFGRLTTFRAAYLGMPFYISSLAPTLLEHIPEGNNPASNPMRGKNLLTFTDSRQGTAKIAVKMQQDAERLKLRGLIYHKCQSLLPDSNRITQLKAQKADFEKMTLTPALEKIYQAVISELNSLNDIPSINWNDLIDELKHNNDLEHIFRYYRSLSPGTFNNINTLIKTLLIREFSRRLKRANSLETLGLVALEYEGLGNINNTPQAWPFSLDDYKDFVKICLNFYIREGIFVNIEIELLNWLGGRFTPKYLLPPQTLPNNEDWRHKIWTQYKIGRSTQSRIIRLLAHGMEYDLANIQNDQIDTLNEIMTSAWNDLTNTTNILTNANQTNPRFNLNLDRIKFRNVQRAYYCPVTLRVLDTTFKGYTPYLPQKAQLEEYKCDPIEMPQMPVLNQQTPVAVQAEIRDWIHTDLKVSELRKKGIWTEQSDRIAEGGYFFRSAEHSAQQPAQKLNQYERQFKEGKINVLNCSTTMEMGVDIGGLSVVCNNNLPPHPSNYLQRAGRAGRRKETRSTSITLCKNNPLEQQVFKNPLWAFNTPMKQPNITLNSERIVQRHINSFLFGYFINQVLDNNQQNNITLQSGWFFIADDGNHSICQRMQGWLKSLEDTKRPLDITKAVEGIKNKSVLENQTVFTLCLNAEKKLAKIQTVWITDWQNLSQELRSAYADNPNSPYTRRINFDLRSHEREYLLKSLISGGFLPGYGFPTDITTFNTYSLEDFRHNNNQQQEREDNLSRLVAKPTRSMSMALSEYVPGAEIVLDGKVYQSRGITFNWQSPNDQQNQGYQLETAWWCSHCGQSGIASHLFNGKCSNPACGRSLNPEYIFNFIQPAGFAVNFYEKPSNNVSHTTRVTARPPLVSSSVQLSSLPNASLGMYRADERGKIFYMNSGINDTGFAICTKCGYTDSMKTDGTIPTEF